MTPAKVEPGQSQKHEDAKPVRWLWEVRRYMKRHGGAEFAIPPSPSSHLRYFVVARHLWPKSLLIEYFNSARKAGENQ